MSDLSTPTTELPSDSKPSTLVADDVGKERDGVSKNIVEQRNDSSPGESLTTMIAEQGHSTPPSNESLPPINAAPGTDLQTPEVPTLQDDDDGEVWIPKGNQDKPNGTQTKPTKPARPPKN